jgi:hypothetical protein
MPSSRGEVVDQIRQGRDRMGLCWAQEGDWRIVECAQGGHWFGCRVEGVGWVLVADHREMPAEIEARLLDALGLPRP